MKKTAIAIALAALLSACATGQKDLPVSSLRFDYVTSGGRELGLVRAGGAQVFGHAVKGRQRVVHVGVAV